MAANGSQTHGRPCRHIRSARPTGDGQWPLPRHVWWRSLKVAALARLCVFGGRRTRTRTLCIWRTLCGHVTIGTPMVIFCCLTVFWLFLTVFHDWYSLVPTVYQQCTKNCQKTVKTAKMTIGVPIVTSLSRLYQQCTNRQKQSKDSQNSKNDNSCTNRHRSTKTVPTVYQKQSKDYQNSNNE